MVVGVDGHSTGWVAVAMHGDLDVEVRSLATIEEVEARWPEVDVIGIDIPIGLPALDDPNERTCDREARARIGPRRSSVFPAPPRECLLEETHGAASALAVRRRGKGISQQAFRLGPKILEVERFLGESGATILEVHPELSFVTMHHGAYLDSKKSFGGIKTRLDLLAANGIEYGHEVPEEIARLPADDVLDAGAVAWTARRYLSGDARPLPDPPPQRNGREIAIWY